MNLVQLTRKDHGHLRLDPAKAAAAAANVHLVPVVRSELRKVASLFPVFFAKDGETGQFYLAALLGLEPHENLYWNGTALETTYVPLNLLRLPFYVGGGDVAQGVICIDLDSPAVAETGPCAIVEADGRDSRYMASVQAMLSELAGQQTVTRGFIDRAVSTKLLIETKLDVAYDNGARASLSGLYGVDERALSRKIGEISDFDDLMALAAMVLSLEHVAGLVRRKNARQAAEAEWFGKASLSGG
jgi:SapC